MSTPVASPQVTVYSVCSLACSEASIVKVAFLATGRGAEFMKVISESGPTLREILATLLAPLSDEYLILNEASPAVADLLGTTVKSQVPAARLAESSLLEMPVASPQLIVQSSSASAT